MSGPILSILALSNSKIFTRLDRTSFCDPFSRCLAGFQFLTLLKNDTRFYWRSSDSFAEYQASHLETFLHILLRRSALTGTNAANVHSALTCAPMRVFWELLGLLQWDGAFHTSH